MLSVTRFQSLLTTWMELGLWLVVFLPTFYVHVQGHGRLVDPPARSSMWRFGFNTPINYDDNALYCGGFDRQWNRNGGRCGVCGDPFDGPREHEVGGRYAKGVISKSYRQGQTIRVSVELTRSHLGWFEFRLCPTNNPNKRVTHACLNSNLLRLQDGSTRYHVRSWATKIHHVTLQLPSHISCSQCVLQWKYNAGNSWGCTGHNTGCCMGCGHQENFYGCADVAIRRSSFGTHSNIYNNNIYNNNNNAGEQIPSRPRPLQSLSNLNILNNNNLNNNNNANSNSGNAGGINDIVGYRPVNSWTNGNQGNAGSSSGSSSSGSSNSNSHLNQGFFNFIRG